MESTSCDNMVSEATLPLLEQSFYAARASDSDSAGPLFPLLLNKITPPERLTNIPLIERPRLLERIREANGARLILFCAPAGYGKTALAAQVTRDEGGAWLSLDQRDNDPARFVAYFVAALDSIGTASGDKKQRLSLVDENTPWTTLEKTLNRLPPEAGNFTLVLDDYHRIENPDIHQLLMYVVEFMPSTLRLILTSRTRPPISLARLRASDELLELTVADLCFSRDEAASYLTLEGERPIPFAAMINPHERSEGWIVALKLLKIQLQEQSDDERQRILHEFGGTNRHIAEFLSDEVLSQWTDARDFLQRTSILARMTGPLCDAVTGHQNGAEMLHALEQAGSLVFRLDDDYRWYRYHRFLSELLHRQLTDALDSDQIASLHSRASDWLSERGLIEEAVGHALLASDWAWAVELMKQLGFEAIAYRDTLKLRCWLDKLPVEVRDSDPSLAYWYGRVLSSTSQPRLGRTFLEKAEADWMRGGSGQQLGIVRMGRAWNAIHAAQYDAALDLARSSISLNTTAPAQDKATSLYTLGVAQVRLGQVREALASMTAAAAIHPLPLITRVEIGHALALSGDLAEAEQEILRGLRNGNLTDAHRRGHIWLAEIYLARNEIDRAADHLALATELSDMLDTPANFPLIEIAWARMCLAKGERTAALVHLADSSSKAAAAGHDDAVRAISCAHSGLLLELGRLGDVGTWCYQAGLDPDVRPDYRRQEELLVYARFLSLTGSAGVASDLLRELHRIAEEDGRVVDTARILVIEARNNLARNQPDQACLELLQALALLEPGGHMRAFIDEGAVLLEPLRTIAALGHHLDFVGRLLQSIRTPPYINASQQNGWPENLTRRELEVLRLVAVGLSNREISDQLFISVPTVKRHISTIFAKLDAANRVQAVNLARAHQLI